jgi:hypothetical protein
MILVKCYVLITKILQLKFQHPSFSLENTFAISKNTRKYRALRVATVQSYVSVTPIVKHWSGIVMAYTDWSKAIHVVSDRLSYYFFTSCCMLVLISVNGCLMCFLLLK